VPASQQQEGGASSEQQQQTGNNAKGIGRQQNRIPPTKQNSANNTGPRVLVANNTEFRQQYRVSRARD